MSKTPQEVEEYLRKYGQAPGTGQPEGDPVAEYLKRYGGPGVTQQPPMAAASDATAVTPRGPTQTSRGEAALMGTVQGATLGFGDELMARAAGAAEFITGGEYGPTVEAAREDVRNRTALARQEHPGTALLGGIAGGVGSAAVTGGASLLPKMAGLLKPVAAGAGMGAGAGAVAGFGEADGTVGERMGGAAGGAKAGALLGGAFSAAAPAIARTGRLMADIIPGVRRGTPSGPISQTTAHAMPIGEALGTLRDATIRTTQERGDDILLQALERSGKGVDDVRSAVASRAGSTPKPESLMEIAGQPMQRLGRSVRTAPGRGSALMDEALTARSAGAEERIIADLLETSGQGKSTNRFQHLDDLIDERRANARPLYEKAYAASPIDDPDILATLELPQFQQAYQRAQRIAKLEGINLPDLASRGAAPARKSLPKGVKISDSEMTGSSGGQRDFVTTARDAKGRVIGSVEFDLFDGSLRVRNVEVLPEHQRKGIATALYDRIRQEFPDARLDRSGTTPEGTAFREFYDATSGTGGIPIQALDYVKRGLDDVIESGMKSGSIARTEARALRNRLKDMLEKVDEAVPEYKAARAQFAGDSELIEAAERGKDLLKTHPDEAGSYIESLSEAGKDAYRKQALSALQDRIENIAPGNNVSRRVGEKTLDQKRLRLLFPDDASFDTFRALLQREAEMHGTKGFVMGGSQTADKLTELADLAGISVEMMMGMANPGRLAQLATQNVFTRGARGVTERNAEAIAQRLKLGMGKDGNAEFDELLKALAAAEARKASQQTRRAGGAAVSGASAGGSTEPRGRRR